MTRSEAIEALITQCAQDKGVEEIPRGSNRGSRVEAMLKTTGLGGGYPWCAAAVATWGVEALGEEWPVPHTAVCDALLAWAKRKGALKKTDPQRGDIFLKLSAGDDNDALHTGIVSSTIPQGAIWSWEGNTNDDGSREGYGVFYRRRSTERLVFVRWIDAMGIGVRVEVRLPETPAYRVWVSPYGLFPLVQMRSGRPCAPVRQLVAAILGSNLERTESVVGWNRAEKLPVVRGTLLPSAYLVTDANCATAWAPVREIGEALGCVVSAGQMLDGDTVLLMTPIAGG